MVLETIHHNELISCVTFELQLITKLEGYNACLSKLDTFPQATKY